MTKNAENKEIVKFELSSGIKVEMDLSKNTARLLSEARKIYKEDETGYEISHYLISCISTFDGETITSEDMKDKLSAFDILELEAQFGALRKKK